MRIHRIKYFVETKKYYQAGKRQTRVAVAAFEGGPERVRD
jgi:hypothetical protein